MRVRSKLEDVERLRWLLLAALGGGLVSCAGKSTDTNSTGGRAGTGASMGGGAGGATGGNGSGGKGASGGTAGTVSQGGSGASGGAGGASGGAGGASGGSGGASGGMVSKGGGGGIGGGGVGGAGGSEIAPCVDDGVWDPNLPHCEGGFVHRPTAAGCALPERVEAAAGAPGIDLDGGPMGACASDADCQPAEYCLEPRFPQEPQDFNFCVPVCTVDTDCDQGQVCACTQSWLYAGVEVLVGRCEAATCTVDAECGSGSLCISPTFDSGCGVNLMGFHCQSPDDECASVPDCGDANQPCMHDGSRFVCGPGAACGRPFLVEGLARTASARDGAAWLDPNLEPPVLDPMPEAALRALAEHYVRTGLMEHASIAAFGRFVLELLAVGAPPALVEEAIRALGDETRHARLTFTLAARYAGTATEPGPLPMTGVLGTVDLLDVVDRAIVEGCLGETGAALEAAWAASAATDDFVKTTLAAIADDEARHAALAFRFVAWAARTEPGVAPLLARRIAEARAASAEVSTAVSQTPADVSVSMLAAHGLLDEATRREARRCAIDEVAAIAESGLLVPAPPAAQHAVSEPRFDT